MLLVGHALKSETYVAALESAAGRAGFFAGQEGRAVAFDDVKRVLIEAGTLNLAGPVQATAKPGSRRRPGKASAPRPRKTRGLPVAHRQPLGEPVAVKDFSAVRPPGISGF